MMTSYKIKMTLQETREPLTRTLIIPGNLTFMQLDRIIEFTFGIELSMGNFFTQNGDKETLYEQMSYEDINMELEEVLVPETSLIYDFTNVDGNQFQIFLEILERSEVTESILRIVEHEGEYQFADFCTTMDDYYELFDVMKTHQPKDKYEEYHSYLYDLDSLRFDEEEVIARIKYYLDGKNEYEDETSMFDGFTEEEFNNMMTLDFFRAILFGEVNEFKDALIHMPGLKYEWIWFHNDKKSYILFENSIEKIRELYNCNFNHDELFLPYLDGPFMAYEEDGVMVGLRKNHLTCLVEDKERRELLDEELAQIMYVLSNHGAFEFIDLKESKYLEFTMEHLEIKDIDFHVDVEPLEVSEQIEEVTNRPKGKDKLVLRLDTIPLYDDKLDEKGQFGEATYLYIKGKTMKDCVRLYGDQPKDLAMQISDYLCACFMEKPKPKTISINDATIASYLKNQLEAMRIRMVEYDTSINWSDLKIKAFEKENPISDEEIDAFNRLMYVSEYEFEAFQKSLPYSLIRKMDDRQEIDPHALSKIASVIR